MKKQRIKIQMIGSDLDHKDVRLEDFIEQLARVKKALNEAEMALTGRDNPTIDYKIVDLKHQSPSVVVLETVALNGTPIAGASDVPFYLASELQSIKRNGELLNKPDLDRLLAYQKIGVRSEKRKNSYIEKVRIEVNKKSVTIDQKFKSNLETILGPDEESEGSISGHLEALNLHNANRFTLFPPIGPKRVSGTFPRRLRATVKAALESFVTVSGKLKYKAWSDLPHTIIAQEIDVHEPDEDLPRFADIRGVMRGRLGQLNSAEFVDNLRIYENW